MNGHYTYSSQIWPSALTLLLLIVLAVYSGRRRGVPGALPFTTACLFAAGSTVSSMMEYAAMGTASKIFWIRFQGAWNLPIVTAITCFFLEYAWPGRWLTRRNLVLLFIPCVLVLGLILTNDLHHLLWRSFSIEGLVNPVMNLGNWLVIFYGLGVLGILNLVICGWLFMRFPQQRWPVVIVMVGQFGGRLVFLAERANFLYSALPLGLLGMAFEFLIYAVLLFGFQILNPIPLAHRTVIEQLQAGMLVVDPQGKIVNSNPSASAILKLPVKRLLGNSIQNLLPAFADTAGNPQAKGMSRREIELGQGSETRYYQLESSSLDDWRGILIGRLLVLRDVTEMKQAEAEILKQQRALATLHEREQLGRDLHDSLGQVLGYASFKMSATRKLIADGKLAIADDQLAHLESSLAEAHADVREYILNLRTAPTGEKPFFSTLRSYLDGFYQNHGIHADISIGPGMGEGVLSHDMQIQLFHILQEAISNARKHAATNHVSVFFGMEDSRFCMRVEDNGKGFDPLQPARAGSGHFGLGIMRERAESLGGSLRVHSAPGEGTCVEVEVPLSERAETR